MRTWTGVVQAEDECFKILWSLLRSSKGNYFWVPPYFLICMLEVMVVLRINWLNGLKTLCQLKIHYISWGPSISEKEATGATGSVITGSGMCVDLNLPESHRSYVIQKPEARLPRVLTLGTEDICEIGASSLLGLSFLQTGARKSHSPVHRHHACWLASGHPLRARGQHYSKCEPLYKHHFCAN